MSYWNKLLYLDNEHIERVLRNESFHLQHGRDVIMRWCIWQKSQEENYRRRHPDAAAAVELRPRHTRHHSRTAPARPPSPVHAAACDVIEFQQIRLKHVERRGRRHSVRRDSDVTTRHTTRDVVSVWSWLCARLDIGYCQCQLFPR